ncbi:MAG TPA: hypothetical protein VHB98_16685, partial [Chloroflexota bacterium]|nr:hypothetical protein [Chloroflexota bacterium]
QAGIPLLGLEPSCASVFRDELTNLLPHDEDAKRLRQQTYLLSEFLVQKAPDYRLPRLQRTAVVHGHCHHKAIMGMKNEQAILQRLGLDCTILDAGCCGMAGSFGFERGEHYKVSMKCGERVLLPAVREAAKDTIIIANGFSCREQIAQATDRHALHLAQVIQMGMRESQQHARATYPEAAFISPAARPPVRQQSLAMIGASALVAGAAVLLGLRERRTAASRASDRPRPRMPGSVQDTIHTPQGVQHIVRHWAGKEEHR